MDLTVIKPNVLISAPRAILVPKKGDWVDYRTDIDTNDTDCVDLSTPALALPGVTPILVDPHANLYLRFLLSANDITLDYSVIGWGYTSGTYAPGQYLGGGNDIAATTRRVSATGDFLTATQTIPLLWARLVQIAVFGTANLATTDSIGVQFVCL